MTVLDVINSPWAIMPDKLQTIQKIYAARINGDKINIEAVEEELGFKLDNKHKPYAVHEGVAVIPMQGVMAKKMNLFSQISGGVSTELLARDISTAVQDPNVKAILLHIDSPGGTVDGTEALSDAIRSAGEEKPVVSFVDGLMASAAYWAGSAAHMVVSSSSTNQIGSIGVVTSHTDVSGAEEKQGIKTTEITAGKFKRIASQHQPLSAEGAGVLQEHVDQIYSIFVQDVAENRGVTPDVVLQDMADGRVFLSEPAQRRGMIDAIASLEETIFNINAGIWPMNTKKAAVKQEAASVEAVANVAAAPVITLETIKKDFPEIASSLIQEGAAAELARIKSCEASLLPGHEALVNSMKFDGKSTGENVAVAIINAEKEIRASNLQAFSDNAPEPVPHAPVIGVDSGSIDLSKATIEERTKAEWDKSEKLQAEFGGNYSAYLAYEKGKSEGLIKILGDSK